MGNWFVSLVIVALAACGGDDGSTGEGTTDVSTAPATASGNTTATAQGCDDKACGVGCTPEVCNEADCSGYACSEQGECLPFDAFYCQSQLDACAGSPCGVECGDPFCNDGDGGMCAPAYCNADAACVPIGRYEMNPCEATTGSEASSGDGSGTAGTAGG